MSEEYLICQAAPTLAGLKTGSLFPCTYDSQDGLMREIRSLNRRLAGKGLRLLPMRRRGRKALLYLYRPARLGEDLAAEAAAELLRQAGYGQVRQELCVRELMRRLQESDEFPHEIGLFLSYPPEDVRGFIEHRGRCSKLVGCWKVYSDVQRAQQLFASYKECTRCYLRRKAMGASMEQLVVAG